MLLALAGVCLPAVALASDRLAGPYVGAVERVVDGDTLAVRVTVWLDLELDVLVRLRGIDAPELRGRCESEKTRAVASAAALASLVAAGPVVLTNVEGDKYFGRVLADVLTPEGVDIAAALLRAGHARAYQGGSRGGWCEIGALDGSEAELAQVAAPE